MGSEKEEEHLLPKSLSENPTAKGEETRNSVCPTESKEGLLKEKVFEFVDSKPKEETSTAVCEVLDVGGKLLKNVE